MLKIIAAYLKRFSKKNKNGVSLLEYLFSC